MAKVLCFAGSLRRESYNKKLVKIAMAGAKEAGAEVTYIDLGDYRLPVFDQDLEAAEGMPENAKKLKRLLKEHDALLIAAPEYNSSITGVLKNTIDWMSRVEPGEKMLEMFSGKVAGIMAASPGALGGLRGLVTLRMILENIGIMVIPTQVAIPQAHEAFTPDGSLKNEKQRDQVTALGRELARLAAQLCGAKVPA
jgi:NAD(P)H-dependent FMN reductase